jgi:hypothetical protein
VFNGAIAEPKVQFFLTGILLFNIIEIIIFRGARMTTPLSQTQKQREESEASDGSFDNDGNGKQYNDPLVNILQRRYIALFLIFAAIYIFIGATEYILRAPGIYYTPHFIYLADGWLHGHFYINTVPAITGDYTLFHQHWYVAFPPLPAILLLPFIAIFHLSHQDFISLFFSLGMGIINIGLMLWVLIRFAQMRKLHLSSTTILWLLIFFAFGTETFYVTMQGSVWFQAHVVATTFLLLHIGESFGKRRPWLAGIFLGLASLSRSATLFAFPFFLVVTFLIDREKPKVMLKQCILFGATSGSFVVGMLLYNWGRFGSLLNATMNVNSVVSHDLHTYGQFNPHFLGINLYYMWVQAPFFVHSFPYITFTPFGTGIFWTMPALLAAFLAFRHRQQRGLAFALLAGCVLPILLLLLYFNTGWVQFGNRFSMDYLPFALLLATMGMRSKLGWPEKILITISIAINVWGYIVFAYLPFATKIAFLR